jgi:hypothetical protein
MWQLALHEHSFSCIVKSTAGSHVCLVVPECIPSGGGEDDVLLPMVRTWCYSHGDAHIKIVCMPTMSRVLGGLQKCSRKVGEGNKGLWWCFLSTHS